MRMQYNAQLQRGKRLWQVLLPDVVCNYNIVVKLVQKKIQFLLQKSITQVKLWSNQQKNNVDLTALQQKLAPNYALLSEIIDYKNSPNCLQKGECDLGGKVGEYSIKDGKSVKITGSISTGKKIVSALLLAHYVGKPDSEICKRSCE